MAVTKDYRSDKNSLGFSTTEERNEQMRDDMMRMMDIIEENSKPTKRWWHRFYTPKQPQFTFEIEDRPTFTEQELAERRAFLDGYSAGRKDGDPGPAYKLWKKMRDHE